MATFVDGSTKAQLGIPDMRVPIQYSLSYPDRWDSDVPRINWDMPQQWSFEPVDIEKFPCFNLARQASEAGGIAPVVLNASNEIAVGRFLNKEIPYIGISKIVAESLDLISSENPVSRDLILDVDHKTREFAKKVRV
jgi:1-deoxy-D-xylulose-5-phosphate reductoisomerase